MSRRQVSRSNRPSLVALLFIFLCTFGCVDVTRCVFHAVSTFQVPVMAAKIPDLIGNVNAHSRLKLFSKCACFLFLVRSLYSGAVLRSNFDSCLINLHL